MKYSFEYFKKIGLVNRRLHGLNIDLVSFFDIVD